MEPVPPYPQLELWLLTDLVLGELDRLHDTWVDGRAPTSAELFGVADDLRRLRETASFAATVSAFESSTQEPVR
ncbi:hypothetical protein AB0L40_27590 [Patulibacter sp. NPDC049589]|uniref:hypothetical protein n=1 Tax=Patulibacter sp. NPDC049589 TaxID=3154731 RepID=UPI0034156BB6